MPKSYSEVKYGFFEKGTDFTYTPQGVLLTSTPFERVEATRVESRLFSGSTFPSWKAFRKQNGYLPCNGASDYIEFAIGIPSALEYLDAENRLRRTMIVRYPHSLPRIPVSRPEMDNAVDIAWSKLRKKLLDQDFNIAVTAAEMGKTVSMISSSAIRLAAAYKSFRRGNWYDSAITLGITPKGAPSSWLAYKYGWTPLLMDIHGAAKTLAELGFKRDQRTVIASHKFEINDPVDSFTFQGKREGIAKAFVTYRVRSEGTTLLNRLGLLNPLSIAWEVIPFSFVVDWFINIGDVIAESTAFSGVTVMTGGTTRKISQRGSLSFSHGSAGISRSSFYNTSFTRTPGVQYVPQLRIKSENLLKPSLDKLVTAGSLLASATVVKRRIPQWGR